MLPSVRELAKIASETLWKPKKPIYEFGSRQVEGGGGDLANIRGFFTDCSYVGVDIQPGPGVDLVTDITSIPLWSGGAVICLETLEHVRNPWSFVSRISPIMDDDSWALFTSPFNFQIHSRPDYWRITPDGYHALLEPFRDKVFVFAADNNMPTTVAALAWKGRPHTDPHIIAFKEAAMAWTERHRHPLKPKPGDRVLICAHDPVAFGFLAEPSRVRGPDGIEFSARWVGMCQECCQVNSTGMRNDVFVRSALWRD